MGMFDSLNPFTGFGLLDSALDFGGSHELQEDAQNFDQAMFDKQSAFAVEQFDRESNFTSSMMDKQYDLNIKQLKDSPTAYMQGLESAGLNPILAATGGFNATSGQTSLGSASADTPSVSKSSGGSGPKANIALMTRYGELLDSEKNLNTAKAEAERAKAGIQPDIGAKANAEAQKAQAEVDRAKAEAKYKNAQTEGVLFDNIKKKNIANVYDDTFGQVLTYIQETGVSKLLTLGAIALGPTFFARFLMKNLPKEKLPKIISLGRSFWNPTQARKFVETMNKLRGK